MVADFHNVTENFICSLRDRAKYLVCTYHSGYCGLVTSWRQAGSAAWRGDNVKCFEILMKDIHKSRKIGRNKGTRITRAGRLVIPKYLDAHSCRTSVAKPRNSEIAPYIQIYARRGGKQSAC